MTKTEITSADVRAIGQEIAAAVKDIADKHGVTIGYGGGRYGGMKGEVKLAIGIKNVTAAVDQAKREFTAYARLLGLEGGDFGKTFVSRNAVYRITGCSISRPTYPVDCVRIKDGKGFKFDAATVKLALGRSLASAA